MNLNQLKRGGGPYFLPEIALPESLRVLSLAPHPDDFDAIGVTLRWLNRRGHLIWVGVVSSGASGVEDGFVHPPSVEAKAAAREGEQRRSVQFFGLPESHLTFLRLREDRQGHPVDDDENFDRLLRYYSDVRPDIVFLPHPNDPNEGHRRTHSLWRRCVTRAGSPALAAFNQDPKTLGMAPDLFTPFGEEEAAWKRSLLLFHQSQHQRNLNTRGYGFDERVLAMNRRAARETLGREGYAEAFEIAARA